MLRILFFGNLPQTRFIASFRFVLSLLWFVNVALLTDMAKHSGLPWEFFPGLFLWRVFWNRRKPPGR